MTQPSVAPGRAHVVALIVLVLLGAGLAVWLRSARPPQSVPLPAAAMPDTTSDRTVEQALDLAGRDSSVIKSRWIEHVSGVELSLLAPERREIFLRLANAERCTCGCGYTLAGCRASDMSCEVSGPRIAALLDSVRSGWIRSARGLRERPRDG
jgi:hypothetical protein